MPPLLVPLLGLIAGIVASPWLDGAPIWALCPLAVLVAVARPRLAVIPVFLWGVGVRSHHDARPPYIVDDGLPVRVEAVLDHAPEFRVPGYYLTVQVVRVNDAPLRGGARLVYFPPEDDPELARLFEDLDLGSGDRIALLVRLRRPTVYRNPGGFDYRRFLERQGIYWTGSIRSPRLITVVSRGWHGGDRLRRWASERIERRLGEDETVRALALGMVLGHRQRLPDAAERRFEAAGLIHLLVVSGFNLAIVAAAAFWLGRRIRFGRRQRALALVFALGVVLVYAFLVEGDAPVARATTMAVILIAGTLLDRGYAIGNALCAAAIVILGVDPLALMDTGFQLTFMAVLAILFLAVPSIRWGLANRIASVRHLDNPALDARLPVGAVDWRVSKRLQAEISGRPLWMGALPRRLFLVLAEIAIVTAAVQLTLLPWTVESYHRLSPVSLPLNTVGAIIAAIVTPLGLILILVPDFAAAPFAMIVEVALTLFVVVVEQGLELPGATFRVPSPPSALWWAFGVSTVGVAWAVRRRSGLGLGIGLVSVTALVVVAAFADFSPPPPEHAALTFVDVGQGDAILVELPDGRRFMVDGGGVATGAYRSLRGEGGFSIGADVLTPYLYSQGIRALDAVVLTHAHHDHMDGLFDLIENFDVSELWVGSNPAVPRYLDLLDHASRRRVPVRRLVAGARAGPFRVLNPPAASAPSIRVANDDSVVLLLDTEHGDALLTGDLESDLPAAPRHVALLKVPHHGSGDARLSTSGRLRVISVGANNAFGHPHPSRLPALRTDVLGAIRVELRPDGPSVAPPVR